MDEKIIAIYCLCDDLLKAIHHYEDPQQKMTDALRDDHCLSGHAFVQWKF